MLEAQQRMDTDKRVMEHAQPRISFLIDVVSGDARTTQIMAQEIMKAMCVFITTAHCDYSVPCAVLFSGNRQSANASSYLDDHPSRWFVKSTSFQSTVETSL